MSLYAAALLRLVLSGLALGIPLRAAVSQQAPVAGPAHAVAAAIDEAIASEPALRGGVQAVIVQSLADGRIWYERDADRLLLPASNQKLLTSAAALAVLGPGWRFRTRLCAVGGLDARGMLYGDLYLVGGGDPLLDAAHLADMARAARKAGVRSVTGRVYGDASRFDDQVYGDGWAWDDMPWYYSAQVSGLNVDENVVQVKADPAPAAGRAVRVTVTPASDYHTVSNRATTEVRGGKSSLFISREFGRNRITVDGAIAIGAPASDHAPEPITVEDPARYAAVLMTAALRREGITVARPAATRIMPRGRSQQIAVHAGQPLAEVLKRLNKPSDNLVAECLLKTLSAEKGKEHKGSWAEGRVVALEALTRLGLDPSGIDMADGSGLSRQNFVTARNLLTLLVAVRARPDGAAFVDSLPLVGVEGTVRSRMKDTPAERNARAKSGYVSSVSSLSGYVTTRDGEPLAFAIVMNNHKARNALATAVQNKIVVALASYSNPGK